MDEPLESLTGIVLGLAARLDESGIPYALGGALALSAWAEPRATRDIDLNLWFRWTVWIGPSTCSNRPASS